MCAFPGEELVEIAAVFVVHDGVQTGDGVLRFAEVRLDGGGAFDTFEVVGGQSLVSALADLGACCTKLGIISCEPWVGLD
jgi:hypothetical protein